ncbi:MAG: hypothetical protein J6W14_03285, partial [Clostridia bacterium]|nr:hypothetical protein [Clostridia bacterium]
DFIRALLGFHRAKHDFITTSVVTNPPATKQRGRTSSCLCVWWEASNATEMFVILDMGTTL